MEVGKHPKLEHQNEFMMKLYNDNYSDETVYNYNRDLSFFADFLDEIKTPFEKVTKITITFYKGWLKERKHILNTEKKLRDSLLRQANAESAGDMAIEGKTASKTNDEGRNDREHVAKTIPGGFVKNNNPEILDPLSVNRILVSLRNYLRYMVEYDYEIPISPDAVQLVRIAKKKTSDTNP